MNSDNKHTKSPSKDDYFLSPNLQNKDACIFSQLHQHLFTSLTA